MIITNHLVQTAGILINKPFFDRLSKGDQDLIVTAEKEAAEWASNKMKKDEAYNPGGPPAQKDAGGDPGRRFLPGERKTGRGRALQKRMAGHDLERGTSPVKRKALLKARKLNSEA